MLSFYESFVENTIESFREAHNRGAQMVEFDIVLTKDKIPIVYHDFMFCINQEQDNHSSDKYLSIAVNQLTYEEIKLYRVNNLFFKRILFINQILISILNKRFIRPRLKKVPRNPITIVIYLRANKCFQHLKKCALNWTLSWALMLK